MSCDAETGDHDKVAQARQRVAAAVEALPTLYALYNGGKDAVGLLHLCLPWRERIRAVWFNAGYPYPETERFVRDSASRLGFELTEAKFDIREQWRERGLPAPLTGTGLAYWQRDAPVKVQHWEHGCRSRGLEFLTTVAEREQYRGACFLSGARAQDCEPGWTALRPVRGRVVRLAPMADWSDAEVWAFLRAEGADLPESYAAGLAKGLDCRICPAMSRDQRE